MSYLVKEILSCLKPSLQAQLRLIWKKEIEELWKKPFDILLAEKNYFAIIHYHSKTMRKEAGFWNYPILVEYWFQKVEDEEKEAAILEHRHQYWDLSLEWLTEHYANRRDVIIPIVYPEYIPDNVVRLLSLIQNDVYSKRDLEAALHSLCGYLRSGARFNVGLCVLCLKEIKERLDPKQNCGVCGREIGKH